MSMLVEKIKQVLIGHEGMGCGKGCLARVREAFTEEVTFGLRPEG